MTDKKKKQLENDYPREAVLRKRKLPVWNIVFTVLLVIIEIAAILFACLYDPKPQDVIENYTVSISPRDDGTLDITYELVWMPLDENEDLTWIEIGMANGSYTVYADSLSGAINYIRPYRDDDSGYYSARVYLDRAYKAGERLNVSFTVNQSSIMARQGDGYIYEYVPGWFNSTPVKSCTVRWLKSPEPEKINIERSDENYYYRTARLDPGGYVLIRAEYSADAIPFPSGTVKYEPFDDSGAWNELRSNKNAAIAAMVVICIICLAIQIYIVDCFVSYHRGRGFLRGYGYHVHTYGRVNPRYRAASRSSGSGGGGGRGCACACACACAGGGRAGCSQKDTYSSKEKN